MTEPSRKDIKRLFAESKNQCAFPNCTTEMVINNSVVGDICHIKGQKPGSARYDEKQTEKERNNYNNLLILCKVHHKVIDDDEESYSVERLLKIKDSHIEKMSSKKVICISDEIAKLFLNIQDIAIDKGSVITTINQSGGQVAHSITNISPPKRCLSDQIKIDLISFLNNNPKGKMSFASTQGDVEADNWKRSLMTVFREAGWQVTDAHTFMFFGTKRGLVVTIPFNAPETGLPQIVATALKITGDAVSANRGDMANESGIYVQVWNSPDNLQD